MQIKGISVKKPKATAKKEPEPEAFHSPFAGMVKVPIQPKDIQITKEKLGVMPVDCSYCWMGDKQVYSQSNIPANVGNHVTPIKGGVIGALWTAYNYHADVVLSPDDVWITVCHAFSIHVNSKAEKLRHYFVNHEGKKDLIVRVVKAPSTPAEWDHVINLFHEAVKGAVKEDTGALLDCAFSTTGPIEKAVASVSAMSTFQEYFNYICMTMCGIRNVYFMGTLDDWKLVKEKVVKLGKFECEDWTSKIAFIIDKFIETYQGKVDLDFWNKVVHIMSTHGSGAATYLSGWVTAFIPYTAKGKRLSDEIDVTSIPEPIFSVPFMLKDNGKMNKFNLKAGFTGLLFENESFRPQLSYALTLPVKAVAKKK